MKQTTWSAGPGKKWRYVDGAQEVNPYCLVLEEYIPAERAYSGKAFVSEVYYIDLERANTTGELLDWIFQVSRKGWADDEVRGGLLRALQDCLNPQATMCSFGGSGSIANVARYLDQKAAA